MSVSQCPNIIECFANRHSCRSFLSSPFPSEKKEIISKILAEVNSFPNPFGTQGVEISETGPGLSRFGATSNESGWLALKIPIKNDISKEEEQKLIMDASYKMQLSVMKMTENKISSCWMGGTFDENEVERRFPGFKVKAVVAYGEAAQSKHFVGKVLGFFSGHEKRLNFEELFYDESNKKPITEKELNEKNLYPPYMKDFLTALRSGPSAMNSQTWRFVLNQKEVHLFDGKCNEVSPFASGIALANLKLLESIRGGNCQISIQTPPVPASPLGGKYVATVTYVE